MQLGIFAKTFIRPTLGECFDAVAGHGLHSVQFNFTCAGLEPLPDEIPSTLIHQIRRESSARQIVLAAVSGTFNLIHPDPRERDAGLRRLSVVARGCHGLGASVLTLCTGTRDPANMWRRHPENDSPEAWNDLLLALEKALQIAEEFGLTLGIEPEISNVIDTAFKARALLNTMKSRRLKIIIDPANLMRTGDQTRQETIIDEAFALLAPDIVLAHAKELGPEGQAGDLAVGAGVLDWERYLWQLRQAHFTGPLILHGFQERDVAASAAFLSSKLN